MKIRKRIIKSILFMVLFAAGVYTAAVFLPEEKHETSALLREPFETIYAETGAEMLSLTLRGWAQVDDAYHDGSSLAALYRNIRDVLGNDRELFLEEYDDDGFSSIVIRGKAENGAELNLTLQSLREGSDGAGTYLIAESRISAGKKDLSGLDRYTASIFSALKADYNPSLLMEGKYKKLISKKEKKEIAESIFSAVDGKIEEQVSDGAYLSCGGFSDILGGGVMSGDHMINLQVALSDNEEEEATYLYVGSPVVFSDY